MTAVLGAEAIAIGVGSWLILGRYEAEMAGSVLTWLAMEQDLVPGTLNSSIPDPLCGPQIAFSSEQRPVRVALSNSFGFGGNNCTLAFGSGTR